MLSMQIYIPRMSYYDNLKKSRFFLRFKGDGTDRLQADRRDLSYQKLLSLEIIEPVAGHGKGKYRVKG